MAPRPAPKMRLGQHSAPIDPAGMDPEMLAMFQHQGAPPAYGITVPPWMAAIGNMLSGKPKPVAPPAAPAAPAPITPAAADSVYQRYVK